MAYKKITNNNYVVDSAADLKKICKLDMNASCYVIEEACEYRLKSTGEWIKQVTAAVSSSSNDVDLSNYATKNFVEEAVATIDLSGYAKTIDVESAVSGLKADIVSKADQSVATAKAYTNTKITEVESKIPDVSSFATKDEIPSVEGLAKTVDIPDVSGFATKEEIPSLEGYAMEIEVEALKANPIFKIFSANNVANAAHEQYGIYIKASDNKTLTEAMKEKGLGMYNFWIEKGSPDMPEVLNRDNESGRGICVVDYYNSPDNWIGYVILFSKGNHVCFRFINHGVANDWIELV